MALIVLFLIAEVLGMVSLVVLSRRCVARHCEQWRIDTERDPRIDYEYRGWF